MKITAVVVREKAQPFTIEELELDTPRADEVLVRIVATRLCHTDLLVRDHYPVRLPVVLGHEGAGVVEQVGDRVTKVKPGDRVVLSYALCGHCVNCQQGDLSYCNQFSIYNLSGIRIDGSATLHNDDEIIYGNFFAQSSFAINGGVNYSLETTALPQVFRQAVDCLARLGVCGLVGAAPLGTEVTFEMNNILSGRIIRGILEGDSIPDIFIPQLIELYLQGRFPFDRLITFYNLEQINQAAADSEQGHTIKPVLRMPA